LESCYRLRTAKEDPPIDLGNGRVLVSIEDPLAWWIIYKKNIIFESDAIKPVTQIQNDMNIINKCDKSLENLQASEEEATTNGVF
jgi:hypothetical protein